MVVLVLFSALTTVRLRSHYSAAASRIRDGCRKSYIPVPAAPALLSAVQNGPCPMMVHIASVDQSRCVVSHTNSFVELYSAVACVAVR